MLAMRRRWVSVVLVTLVTSVACGSMSCRLGLRLAGQEHGFQRLEVLDAGVGCRCREPRIMLLCDAVRGTPCGQQLENCAGRPLWREVKSPGGLRAGEIATVHYAGWYSVQSYSAGCLSISKKLWVDGFSASSWNITVSDEFVPIANHGGGDGGEGGGEMDGRDGEGSGKGDEEGGEEDDEDDGGDDEEGDEGDVRGGDGRVWCLRVQVVDQFDPSTTLQLAFPRLRLCLSEPECLAGGCTSCKNVPFPQRSGELFCGRNGTLSPGVQYRVRVSPLDHSLCDQRLPSCPKHEWYTTLPPAPPPEVAQVGPRGSGGGGGLSKKTSLLLGLAAVLSAAAGAVVAAWLVWKRIRGRQTSVTSEEAPFLPVPPTGAVLLAAPACISTDRRLAQLRDQLEKLGLRTLTLRDRSVVRHMQRHPSVADALSRPLLLGARIVFITGGGGGGGGGGGSGGGDSVQQQLFMNVLEHVRGSPLSYDYRRVFVVTLGDAAPDPLLAGVTAGRLFHAEDAVELAHHLRVSPAAVTDLTIATDANLFSPEPSEPPEEKLPMFDHPVSNVNGQQRQR